jgi:hypothetical protein
MSVETHDLFRLCREQRLMIDNLTRRIDTLEDICAKHIIQNAIARMGEVKITNPNLYHIDGV